MKQLIFKDFWTIFGLALATELVTIFVISALDPFNVSRDTRDMMILASAVLMVVWMTRIMFKRYAKSLLGLVYGLIAGILIIFPTHITLAIRPIDLWLVLYTILGALAIAALFVFLLSKKMNKSVKQKVEFFTFEDIKALNYSSFYNITNMETVDQIKINDLIRLPKYIEDGVELKVKKIYTNPATPNKAFYISDGNKLDYIIFASARKLRLGIKHFDENRDRKKEVENKIQQFFNRSIVQ